MALSSFVLAKIASLPLMLLYCFIGASTGALLSKKGENTEEMDKIENNHTLIFAGIGLSCVTIACITRYIKKELNKVSLLVSFFFLHLKACHILLWNELVDLTISHFFKYFF